MTRLVFGVVGLVLLAAASAHAQLRPDPRVLRAAAPELLDRVRADPYNYFRLVNREWTARVCKSFAAQIPAHPIVQLHGDAHVEQYALMDDAWGLDDFDDSARGPSVVDLVRFLGSIDLAVRQRGWTSQRESLFDRFFAGYRRGLTKPSYRPPRPAIVGRLRAEPSPSPPAFLVWGETRMQPMSDAELKTVDAAMEALAPIVRRERPDLGDAYFGVVRAGWLHMGIGSAATPKILLRVQGPSPDPGDDVLLEAKAVRSLDGVACLDPPMEQGSLRVITGSRQLGRLKHNILVEASDFAIPGIGIQAEYMRDWSIRSWNPTYREIGLKDFRSAGELAEVVYDSGVQLGAGSFPSSPDENRSVRASAAKALASVERPARQVAKSFIAELLEEWREFAAGR